MTLKSKALKRTEAETRAISYTWENSKAKRTGKGTEADWAEKNKKIQNRA